GGEEVHDGLLLERRRVRDVDDDRGALKNVSQSLSGERVDAGVWRCGHGLVTVFPELGDELRADESGAADDDEFHDRGSFPFVTVPCCRLPIMTREFAFGG